MELKKYKLGECLELQRGYDLTSSQMQGGEVEVVGSNGIIGYHNSERGNSPCITVGRSGSVGKVHYYEQPTWAHNTALFIKDFKGNNPKYLYYLLKNLHLDNIFEKGSSVIPSLDRKLVHSLVVPFHKNINDQRKVVDVLSAIDRKIELNKQINDNLEAMAKQLYDYWFVQFDFPNEEGKPYKSSGGAMVWNEKLKREIPQGWGTQNLADCLKLKTERVNSKDIKDTDNYTPIEVIPRKQMSLHETVALENAMSGICRYSRRNILLSNRRVYFHKVCIAPFDGLTRDTVLVLEPYNSGNLGYLYETVFADEFILFATKHSYGSEQPVLSWTSAQKFNVLRPSNTIDKKYSEIVDSIIDSVLNNQIEIIKLTKQRDELLPLLMNGQASVNSD